jgi:putative intracellular protease/amidase
MLIGQCRGDSLPAQALAALGEKYLYLMVNCKEGGAPMNKITFVFIALITMIGLVSCTSDPISSTQTTLEQPEVTNTPFPTVEATPTPEPTKTPKPEPSATPAPTLSPTEAPPTPELKPSPWEPERPEVTCEPTEERTCVVLYVFADQYDDEHVVKMGPSFERAGYSTYLASNTLEQIRGYHECYDFTPANPDMLLEQVDVSQYDAILFIGTDGWNTDLHSDPAAHRIAQEAFEQGKVVVATGDGPVILARAGLLDGKTVNVKKDVPMHGISDEWFNIITRHGAIYTDQSPVRDGLLVTADFGTIKVAWAIIEVLEEQFQ